MSGKILSASGYRPYDYLSSPIFVDGFLADFYPVSLATSITESVVESTRVKHGQEYIFRKRPRAEWFDYRKNQRMEPTDLTVETVSMVVGRAKGFLLKVDALDEMTLPDFNMYIAEWQKDAKEQLALSMDMNIINTMVHQASACNKGNAAGVKYGNLQLGVTGAPVAINKDNILTYLMYLGIVLDEQNAPKQNRFVILPAQAQVALQSNTMFMSQCASGSKPLILADVVPNLAGFKIYFSANTPAYNDPSGKIAFPIVAGVKNATYFAMGMQDTKAGVEDVTSWGKYWKGLAVFDWKVVRPEFLAVAYATIQI